MDTIIDQRHALFESIYPNFLGIPWIKLPIRSVPDLIIIALLPYVTPRPVAVRSSMKISNPAVRSPPTPGPVTLALSKNNFTCRPINQRPIKTTITGAHLIASLFKQLIQGTFQGCFEPKYLQNYLDEYVFRFNCRKCKYVGKKFMCIVEQVVRSVKIKCNQIQWKIDPISEFFSLELCR